jgi:hypothetical protein
LSSGSASGSGSGNVSAKTSFLPFGNPSPTQTENQIAKEISASPKGLVLEVVESGESSLKVGQLVDGNLSPVINTSSQTGVKVKKLFSLSLIHEEAT